MRAGSLDRLRGSDVWASGLVGACAVLLGASGALAQAQADPFAGVEEMVVTGSAAADLLNQSSTQAITFDTKQLQNIGIEDVGDLDAYVPNLEIASVNATNASFFVRGVGLQDFGANASSSVPIFQDGVPRNPSATQLVGLFDIADLSVLYGPQGSGNLRNASAGAFMVKTRSPEPEFSGSARVTLSKLWTVDARDANQYQFESAMNAPIYEDIVSARISARYKHENPFWENRCANRIPIEDRPIPTNNNQTGGVICGERVIISSPSLVTPFLRRYLNEVDDYGLRGQLRIKPPDVPLDWIIRAEMSNLNRDSTTGQHIGTVANFLGAGDTLGYQELDLTNRQNFIKAQLKAANPALTNVQLNRLSRPILARELYKDGFDRRPYTGALNSPGRTLLETYSISTTAVYEAETTETTVNFGYIDYRKSEGRDTDLSPNQVFGSVSDDQAWEIYGDVAVHGDGMGPIPIEWDTGFYTLFEQVESFNDQSLFGFLTEASRGSANRTRFEQEIYSWGVFAQASWEFVEGFTLSGGGRYNWEQKDFDVANTAVTVGPGGVLIPVPSGSRNQRTWDAMSGFINLGYDFTEEVSAYVKYTKGFKAGHFNPSDATAARIPGEGFADPENIDALEFGMKGGAWGSRVQGNAAFFLYRYKDYQVFRLTQNFQGLSRVVENAEQARNMGIEVALAVSPLEGYVPEMIEGLRLDLRFGWLDTSFIDFAVLEQRILADAVLFTPINFSGNQLLNTANLSTSGIVSWPIVGDAWGKITPQYDFSFLDDMPFDPNNGRGQPDVNGNSVFRPYTVGNRAYMLHNLRLSWAPPGDTGLEISGWCKNILDKRFKTFAVDLSAFRSIQLVYVGDPRICGADFRFTW